MLLGKVSEVENHDGSVYFLIYINRARLLSPNATLLCPFYRIDLTARKSLVSQINFGTKTYPDRIFEATVESNPLVQLEILLTHSFLLRCCIFFPPDRHQSEVGFV